MTMSLMHQWHDTIYDGVIGPRRSLFVWMHPRYLSEKLARQINALLLVSLPDHNELVKNGAGGSAVIQPPTHPSPGWKGVGKEKEAPGLFVPARLQVTVGMVMLSVVARCFKTIKGGETYVTTLPWKDFLELFFSQYFPRSEQQKYEREYHTIRQRDEETSGKFMKSFLRLPGFVGKKTGPPEEHAKHFKWALCDQTLDGIVNMKFTHVAQVADAARNIEILRKRSSQNNKRNRDGDRIRPIAQGSNQRGYDQKRYDGHGHDRHGSSQRGKDTLPCLPILPCDICGKLYSGKALYRGLLEIVLLVVDWAYGQGIALRMGAYGCILDSRDSFRSNLRFISVIIIIICSLSVSSAAFSFPAAAGCYNYGIGASRLSPVEPRL
ncbi:hypothetical protein Tco_0401019 [Tanacetum coccineum]